jgi:hypothetical protein
METVIKATLLTSKEYQRSKVKFFSPAFLASAEEMRFGIVPAILTVVICLSGIAAAVAAESGLGQLIMVGAPTAFFITTIIAVMPMRLIFSLALITVLMDLIIFFI